MQHLAVTVQDLRSARIGPSSHGTGGRPRAADREHDEAAASTDGRARRAQRTRVAVLTAVVALFAEGDLRPTAPRIAARAGVSLRSVFQHFSDLDALFTEATESELARIAGHVRAVDPSGDLEGRIEAFVAQRSRVLEQVTPASRAVLAQEATSAMTDVRDRLLALARLEVARTFAPELRDRGAADRDELLDGLDAVTGWEIWEALRAHQRLGVDQARRVVARVVRALLS